jgi:U3 small nucleolar RNA-associated protein MPP10
MEDQEEMDDNNGKLKIPDDVRGDPDDEYDEQDDNNDNDDKVGEGKDIFGAGSDHDAEDVENDVFALARVNKELEGKGKNDKFANQDMSDKITKIENDMMDKNKWQLKGEVQCKDRNYNSLLEEHVDFDTATKAPPQITQETTNEIEAMIKQRILDELFDDPIRKA